MPRSKEICSEAEKTAVWGWKSLKKRPREEGNLARGRQFRGFCPRARKPRFEEGNPLRNVHARREISLGAENSADFVRGRENRGLRKEIP